MASEWQNIQFSDVLLNGTRNGVYKKKEFHGSGTKIVNMGELFAHPRLFDVPMKRVELTDVELEKSLLQPGDLLFARRSLIAEGAGKCSIVMEINEPTTFESSIIRARPNPEKTSSLFLYYLFNSPQGRYLLGTILRQVAVSGITGSDLVQLRIPLPPLNEQKAIASILGTLDEKIELNQQMNETLVAMDCALFRSWFVDFDPIYAKAEGRNTGLPKSISALFPEKLEDSELGKIPKGWEIESIGEAVKCVGGSTPSTKNPAYWDGGTNPFVTPKDMSSLKSPVLLETGRHITDEGVDTISSGSLPSGTVLLSSRAPIGYLAITELPTSINQGIIAMICDKELPNYYVLQWAETNMETIKRNAGGTTFAEISKRNFRPIKVIIPDSKILDAYVQQVGPLYRRIVLNVQESNTLSLLFKSLIPKLISGELRVKNLDRFLKEAIQ